MQPHLFDRERILLPKPSVVESPVQGHHNGVLGTHRSRVVAL